MSNPKWQMMDKWKSQEWGHVDVCAVLVGESRTNITCIVLSDRPELLFCMPDGRHMALDWDDPRFKGFKRFGELGGGSEDLYPSDRHPANKRVKRLEYAIERALASDDPKAILEDTQDG